MRLVRYARVFCFFTLALAGVRFSARGQVVITTSDTAVCAGSSVTLTANYTGRNPNLVNLPDDLHTGIIPIGFPFTFYGNTYTNCVISSNGYVSFNTSLASTTSTWTISATPLPNTSTNTQLRNAIMACHADLFPNNAGDIDWALVGTAPNRKFVATWCNMPYWTSPLGSCSTARVVVQAVLFEGTNVIEINTRQKDFCSLSQSGRAIQGIQNSAGTVADIVPSRNANVQWNATNSSYRFTPGAGGTYTVTSIPYSFISRAAWYLNNTTFVGVGSSITVTPTTNSFYTYSTDCADNFFDTVNISILGSRLYVDSSVAVSGTGASWASPLKTVSQALALVNAGACVNEVWVKRGTYFPMAGTAMATSRDSSLRVLRNGVKLYGSFAGGETTLAQRTTAVMAANPTTLSGDIGVANDSTDNSHHVMTLVGRPSAPIDSNTVVDGFTITRGNADGIGNFTVNTIGLGRSDAGGVYNAGQGTGNNCSPKFANCTVVRNTAQFGGGMYNAGFSGGASNPVIRFCTFRANQATGNGGGIMNNQTSSPVIANTTFADNSAAAGGAVVNSGPGGTICSPQFLSCTFTANAATGAGGALNFSGTASRPKVIGCTFNGNAGSTGGAIRTADLDSLTISASTFTSNTATGAGGGLSIDGTKLVVSTSTITDCNAASGGAMEFYDTTSATLTGCVFSFDSVSFTGGIMRINEYSTVNAMNCRFLDNYAAVVGGIDNGVGFFAARDCIFSGNKGTLGGAVNNFSGSTTNVVTLTNCVFAGNQNYASTGNGGAIHAHTGTTTAINNCTFNDNTTVSTTNPNGNAIATDAGATVNVNNSILWGSAAVQASGIINFQNSDVKGVTLAAPNLNVDPRFVNPTDPDGTDNVWATLDDGLHLDTCSPVIGAGSNALIPTGVATDITGAARIQNGVVDMGAYEHPYNFIGFPDVFVTATPQPACAGAPITFTATATNGGIASYQWFVNSAAAGTNASTFTSSTLVNNDTVWAILTNADCGYFDTSNRVVVAITPGPTAPGPITGDTTPCPGVSQTYSIAPVAGATSYTWTTPAGWTGTSISANLNTTPSTTAGNVTVTATTGCGTSPASTLAVTPISAPPTTPGPISGPAIVCAGGVQTYSVTPVSGASTYTWTLPGGWTGTSTTASIVVTTSSNSGTISVTATSACGLTSGASTLTVTSGGAASQPGPISGVTTVCSGVAQTYSINPVAGASSYTWTLPSGWTGSSTGTSITATPSGTGGTITVVANASCGASSQQSLVVTSSATPAQPSIITGAVVVCSGVSQTYNLPAVPGATTYTWSIPAGWSGASNTNSITVTPTATGGTISVTAGNSCGTSPSSALAVTSSATPVQPGTITGPATVCNGVAQTYSVIPIAGATSYTWSLPGGWTGSSTGPSITVTPTGAGGVITVSAGNGCGTSATSALTVTSGATPAQAVAIGGPDSVCVGTSATYSVAPVAGATSYAWTLPTGWSGTSTTSSITTTAGAASGTITVAATNGCGTSIPQGRAVTSISVPAMPGGISGSAALCAGATETYSIAPIAGATSYTWTVPGGWSGSSNSASITTTASATSGTVSVTAVSVCGSAAASTLAVSVTSVPAQIGTVSGQVTPCAGTPQTYSIASVPGATSYTWSLPVGWAGASTGPSISTTTGITGGAVTVTAQNSCGQSTASLTVTALATPASPGAISGNAAPCANTQQTYSVASVPGAASYAWTLPTGWTGTSTSSSIVATVSTSAAPGTITVSATNACGTSATSTLAVTPSGVAAAPGGITGNASPCAGSSQTYSIAPVTGATSYTWTTPSGWTGSSTGTSITTIPSGTSGLITVSANTVCGASAATSLTVTVGNAPATPGTIAGPAAPCVGTSQTYSVTPLGNANSYTWTLPGTGWTGTSNTASITTPVGSGAGTITVTATNGCGTSAAGTLAVTPSVAPGQPAAISGSVTPCVGTAQTYSVATVTGATSYSWTTPTGWTGTSTTPSLNTTPGAASGPVTVTATNACGTGAVSTLTVTPITTPAQPGTITLPASICQGSTGTYSVPVVTGATSYIWTLPVGWTGAGTGNSITATAGGSGTISVTANNVCGASPVRAAAVIVAPLPAQPTGITGSTTVCVGSQQVYTAAAVPNAIGYTWTLPAGWSGTSTTSSIPVTTGAAGSGQVTVSAQNGCGSGPSVSLPVTVLPLTPTAVSISSSTGSGSVCSGVPVTFTAVTTGAGAAPTYAWTRNGTLQSALTGSATFTISTPLAGDVIGLTLTSSAACPLPATAAATPVTITVPPPVVPGININTQFTNAPVICASTPLSFTANIVGGGTAPQYQWLLNGQAVGSNTPTYSNAVWSNGDVVQAMLTSNAQCATPATMGSNMVTITVSPPVVPTVSITASPGTAVAPGQPVTFTANVTGGGTGPAFQWIRNGAPIPAAFGPTYTTSALGGGDTISVRLTSTYLCASPATVFSNLLVMTGSTGVVHATSGAGISLYPSPNDGRFTLAVQGGRPSQRTAIDVLNALGQVVYTREVITERTDWEVPLELTDVASGIYLLRLRGEDGSTAATRFEVRRK